MSVLIAMAFLGPCALVIVMTCADLFDAYVDRLQLRRLRQLDDSIEEPGSYQAGPFNMERSNSDLRYRFRQRLELEPRGRWGFAAKWKQDA